MGGCFLSPSATQRRWDIQVLAQRLVRILSARATSPAERCVKSSQLVGEKSLVTERSQMRPNSHDISKGVLKNDICQFESYMPCGTCQVLRNMHDIPAS